MIVENMPPLSSKTLIDFQPYYHAPVSRGDIKRGVSFGITMAFWRMYWRDRVVYRYLLALGLSGTSGFSFKRKGVEIKNGINLDITVKFWRFYLHYYDSNWK